MKHTYKILSELNHIFRLSQIFGPLSIRLKGNLIKPILLHNIITVTIASVAFFFGAYFTFNVYFIKGIVKTVNKVLTTFLSLSIILKMWTVFFYVIMDGKKVIKLWNKLLKLENRCNLLDLKHESSKKINIFIVICSHSYLTYKHFGEIFYNNNAVTSSALLLMVGSELLASILLLKYISLLTLYKNYFQQLNKKLEELVAVNKENRIFILKTIILFDEELFELTKLTNEIFSKQIISEFIESVAGTIGNLYNILSILYSSTYVDLETSIYYGLQAIGTLLIIIIPAELCLRNVSNC